MKTLFIVRHAKSSWAHPGLSDWERPLNHRGERDAPRMGKRMAARNPQPVHIVTSSAVRARATAETIARKLGLAHDAIEVDDALYGAGPVELLDRIRRLDDRHDRVMLVAHNPGLTELVEALTRAGIRHLPTCAVATVQVETASWKAVAQAPARLIAYDDPKQ